MQPGTTAAVSYVLRAGEGPRCVIGAQNVILAARPDNTAHAIEMAIISGPEGAAFPAHVHTLGHEALLLIEGELELEIDGLVSVLRRGDYASIPSGTVHAYRMKSPFTRVIAWTINGLATMLYTALADEHRGASGSISASAAEIDTRFRRAARASGERTKRRTEPDAVVPYVLEAGGGERLVAGDQLFTFLSSARSNSGLFLTITTSGAAGSRIPMHFHGRHTETFYCVSGHMTMWIDGTEVSLRPGDFVHVPPRTVHAYRLDTDRTEFVGVLAPGLFESFFRTLATPAEGDVASDSTAPMDRVLTRLEDFDLTIVESAEST